MDWYYSENGKQAGPVSEPEFQRLAATGVIQPDTLVWNAGMKEWLPYKSAFAAPGDHGAQRFCTVCGTPHPASDLAFYGDSAVCAACKPGYVQRLRQGMATGPHAFRYAGFWVRAGALILDAIIFDVFLLIVGYAFSSMTGSSAMQVFTPAWDLLESFSLLFGIAYYCYFWTQYGATPGKMILKLKVVTPEGELISLGRGVGRYFAIILSSLILCIGFMMAGWDDQKRALHDRIAGTRVIRTS